MMGWQWHHLDHMQIKRGASPIFGPCLLQRNGWMDQHGTWHRGGPWSTLCQMGTQLHLQKGGNAPPHFRPIFIVAKQLDASRCHLVRRQASAQGLCVRWGPSSPSSKRGQSPQFLAHVYCGQTAGWIKIPLGTEVGLDPGNIVLDVRYRSPKGTQPPHFRRMSVVTKRLHGLRCHLVWRQASAQATLCQMGSQLPPP